MGEAWCSEFYSWVVNNELNSIGHIANVATMMVYFQGYDQFSSDDISSLPSYILEGSNDFRGDYLAVNGTTHSAMLLTYDEVLDAYWTLDGNSTGTNPMANSDRQSRKGGNEVMVKTRSASEVTGLGKLDLEMK